MCVCVYSLKTLNKSWANHCSWFSQRFTTMQILAPFIIKPKYSNKYKNAHLFRFKPFHIGAKRFDFHARLVFTFGQCRHVIWSYEGLNIAWSYAGSSIISFISEKIRWENHEPWALIQNIKVKWFAQTLQMVLVVTNILIHRRRSKSRYNVTVSWVLSTCMCEYIWFVSVCVLLFRYTRM